MCGIAGIITPDAQRYQEALKHMVDVLRHRGPDDSGIYCFKNCFLGHARLSIIDVKTGQQPMLSYDGKTGVTFNGEIYGYKAIKSRFSDYSFQTSSDTEVIMALYQRYGKAMMSHLPGMFAFSIWDEAQQELFCARDRFGEKPFFYATGHNGEFLFASEIKSLLTTDLINPVISRKAMTQYLQHLYVHPRQTIYENIHVLPPAHTLIYKNGVVKVESYWQLPETNKQIQMDEAVEQFRNLLDQAVKRQLVADVPVAAFLSGGLDSSSIVAVASKYHSNLQTMSFSFENDLSELPYARDVKDRFKTKHIELTDEDVDIAGLLIKMAEIYDEPFADSSNIPTYLISKLAREHAKVVLTGDGGDELFGGYTDWYKPLLFMEREPDASMGKVLMARIITKMLSLGGSSRSNIWRQKVNGLSFRREYSNISRMHHAQNCYFTDHDLLMLGMDVAQNDPSSGFSWEKSDTVDDALRMDLENYMPGDILVKIDRASMSNGLELRAPFLDIDFASFCISLPSRLKLSTQQDKLILRKSFSDVWPESICTRKKQGFGAPVSRWLKRDGVHALKEEYLNDQNKKIFNFVSFENSRNIFDQDDYQTWILLTLALWMEKYKNF